ncbi:MAG: flagella basal body P-ring formation protein FlgA [Phycisphaerae bacterium]|nr:flagella basal body P-ring formation protein FlgA [Phycisphaerae bacterium]|tara:strand:+ start:1054 stop:2127 length:1074 start_codon:yes stop_codon:yes gene_type:complete
MNMLAFKNVIGLLVVVMATAATADSITLRSSATRPLEAKTITLGEIATLQGEEARGWSELDIVDVEGRDPIRITVADVRRRLDEAGVHWGKINLNGQLVVVRPDRSVMAQPPSAMKAMRIGSDVSSVRSSNRTEAASDLSTTNTLRGAVMRYLVKALDTTPACLKIIFDAQDDRWLDETLDSTRYEIKAMSDLAMSDRIDLELRRWSEGRPGERRLLKVKPLIKCTVAQASENLPRHSTIQPDQVNAVESWLTPSQRTLRLHPADVIGRLPVAPLRQGTMFRSRDIRSVQLVDRGDQVVVRCLVGGAAISLKAKAETAGGLGETIELRKGRERETFTATVTGPGEAIIDVAAPVTGT